MPAIYVSDKDILPDRAPFDLYVTEPGIIHLSLNFIRGVVDDKKRIHRVLDVGAGDGRWGAIAKKHYLRNSHVTGVEIRDTQPLEPQYFDKWYAETDYMSFDTNGSYNVIIGNPPFKYAEEIVRHSWSLLSNNGWIAFLLPIEFQCSVGRYTGLWEKISPVHVTVLSRRPSFYNGKTGGSEFGIYYWNKTKLGLNSGVPRYWTVDVQVHERGQYDSSS